MQDGVPERTCPHISGHDRGHTHHHIPARYLDQYLPGTKGGVRVPISIAEPLLFWLRRDWVGSDSRWLRLHVAPTPDGSGSMQLRLHTLNFVILSIKKVNY